MITSMVLEKARLYVEDFFRNTNPQGMFYHNLEHTLSVVEATIKVGQATNLDHEQLESALLAAWFHDIGYYKGSNIHEQESARIAHEFLSAEGGFKEDKINFIIGCIYATKMPQKPKNIVEEVLCDADLAHLSDDFYFDNAEKLRREISEREGLILNDEKWLNRSKNFFEKHNYFTDYGRCILQPGKLKNYNLILARLQPFSLNPS
jgi:predicted metal-dependent HD superfamily phosphohydrolase